MVPRSVVALIAILLLASSVSDAQTPKRGGVLRIGNLGEPPSLDPHWGTQTITEVADAEDAAALGGLGVGDTAREEQDCDQRDDGSRYHASPPRTVGCASRLSVETGRLSRDPEAQELTRRGGSPSRAGFGTAGARRAARGRA